MPYKELQPHGTPARRRQGCGCDDCRAAWNAYYREWYARRRSDHHGLRRYRAGCRCRECCRRVLMACNRRGCSHDECREARRAYDRERYLAGVSRHPLRVRAKHVRRLRARRLRNLRARVQRAEETDCRLAALVRSGTPAGDELMWRILQDMAGLP